MKKTILNYGLVAGVILAAFICVSIPFMKQMTAEGGATSMAIGYTVQFLAFSVIFFAIRRYRDHYSDGSISFGKASQIGLLISLIGSAFYVITWAIVYNTVLPDFMDRWEAAQIQSALKKGAGADQIALIKQQVAEGKQLYSTWWGFAGITLCEILPTGIVVTLISSIILKRKRERKLHTA